MKPGDTFMGLDLSQGGHPGDTFMGLDLSQGGHLTHGSPVNASGILYHAVPYGLDEKTTTIRWSRLPLNASQNSLSVALLHIQGSGIMKG